MCPFSKLYTAIISGGPVLALAVLATLTAPLSALAQIDFSEDTAELTRLEFHVNNCAEIQTISACHHALSQTHILQTSHAASENTSDRIMRNAVILLPLNMLAQLYKRKGRRDISCGYAQSGERQLHRLLKDLDTLMAQDPTAFKNIERLKGDLKDVQAKFDPLLKRCD